MRLDLIIYILSCMQLLPFALFKLKNCLLSYLLRPIGMIQESRVFGVPRSYNLFVLVLKICFIGLSLSSSLSKDDL